jgi:hypothetical protein
MIRTCCLGGMIPDYLFDYAADFTLLFRFPSFIAVSSKVSAFDLFGGALGRAPVGGPLAGGAGGALPALTPPVGGAGGALGGARPPAGAAALG